MTPERFSASEARLVEAVSALEGCGNGGGWERGWEIVSEWEGEWEWRGRSAELWGMVLSWWIGRRESGKTARQQSENEAQRWLPQALCPLAEIAAESKGLGIWHYEDGVVAVGVLSHPEGVRKV